MLMASVINDFKHFSFSVSTTPSACSFSILEYNLVKILHIFLICFFFFPVLFSHSFKSDCLQTHGLHHAGLPYPSPIPRVYSNSCPLSQWCHPTISSSLAPFSFVFSLSQYQGFFHMSWFFSSGGRCLGASASVLSINFKDWFPLGLTGFISSLSKGLSRVFSV